ERKMTYLATALDMSPDGARLAVGGFEGRIDLFAIDLSAAEKLKPAPPPRPQRGETIWALAFSPDGKRLVASLARPLLWDLNQPGQFVHLRGTGTYNGHSLAFSPDGRRLVGTPPAGFLWVWDVDRRVIMPGSGRRGHQSNDAAFSPDGTALAS